MKLYTKILLGMLAGILVGTFFNLMSQPGRFQRIDTNKDRSLSWTEHQAAPADDRFAANQAEFAQLDSDGDEAVSRKEYDARYNWARFTVYTDWIGTIFIRLVKMLVVPLVLVSLVLGSANLGDIRKIGKMGAKAFLFFMFTTAVAA
ncbi:MAG: hypothetical protein D6722_16955, partial [Bacteroidetes bacterium]